MKEVPCFQSLQSRHFEARRGLAQATPPMQNVLAQGQSEAHGDSKYYCSSPSKNELEVVGNCANGFKASLEPSKLWKYQEIKTKTPRGRLGDRLGGRPRGRLRGPQGHAIGAKQYEKEAALFVAFKT